MKSKLLILSFVAFGGKAKSDESAPPDFPEMQASGGVPRHQVALNLMEKRKAFNSCHNSLKARADKSKSKSKSTLSFEQARVVDSKTIQDKTVQADGLINSTNFVKPTNSTYVNISGDVVLHFSINPDGTTGTSESVRVISRDRFLRAAWEK